MTKIYYWKGALGNKEDLEKYRDIIGSLLNSELRNGLNFEKLKGHNIYSVRINQSDRLLFTTIIVNGQPYLQLLEVVDKHKYDRAKSLKNKVLPHYKTDSLMISRSEFSEGDFEVINPLPDLGLTDDGNWEYQATDYCNKTLFILNDQQTEMLSVTLPALVSGMPGSGKSTTSLLLIEQFLNQQQDVIEPVKILYVAKFQHLVDSMRQLLEEIVQDEPQKIVQVVFKTYQDLLQEQAVSEKAIGVHKPDLFANWWANYLKRIKSKLHDVSANELVPLNKPELIYQEFCILSGYEKDEYMNLGVKQSHFALSREIQALLYKAFQDYIAQLPYLDADLTPLTASTTYDLVIADEVQNLSLISSKSLQHLAINSNICYLMDSHQAISFSRSLVRPWLLKNIDGIKHIKLPFSYRCPTAVAAIAQKTIELKQRIIGGLADKDEYSRFEQEENVQKKGCLQLVNPQLEIEKNKAIDVTNTKPTIIIAYKEEHNTVKKLFQNPIIFSPDQIAGLEFKTVMLFNLFDSPILKKADQLLINAAPKHADTIYQPKHREDNEFVAYQQAFNQLFTCITRTMDELIIWQTIQHGNHSIMKELSGVVAQFDDRLTSSSSSSSSSSLSSSDASDIDNEWRKVHDYLISKGQFEKANDAAKHITKRSPVTEQPTGHSPAVVIHTLKDTQINLVIDAILKPLPKNKKAASTNPFDQVTLAKYQGNQLIELLFRETTKHQNCLFDQIVTNKVRAQSFSSYLAANKGAKRAVLTAALTTWHLDYPQQPSPLLFFILSGEGRSLLQQILTQAAASALLNAISLNCMLSLLEKVSEPSHMKHLLEPWLATYQPFIVDEDSLAKFIAMPQQLLKKVMLLPEGKVLLVNIKNYARDNNLPFPAEISMLIDELALLAQKPKPTVVTPMQTLSLFAPAKAVLPIATETSVLVESDTLSTSSSIASNSTYKRSSYDYDNYCRRIISAINNIDSIGNINHICNINHMTYDYYEKTLDLAMQGNASIDVIASLIKEMSHIKEMDRLKNHDYKFFLFPYASSKALEYNRIDVIKELLKYEPEYYRLHNDHLIDLRRVIELERYDVVELLFNKPVYKGKYGVEHLELIYYMLKKNNHKVNNEIQIHRKIYASAASFKKVDRPEPYDVNEFGHTTDFFTNLFANDDDVIKVGIQTGYFTEVISFIKTFIMRSEHYHKQLNGPSLYSSYIKSAIDINSQEALNYLFNNEEVKWLNNYLARNGRIYKHLKEYLSYSDCNLPNNKKLRQLIIILRDKIEPEYRLEKLHEYFLGLEPYFSDLGGDFAMLDNYKISVGDCKIFIPGFLFERYEHSPLCYAVMQNKIDMVKYLFSATATAFKDNKAISEKDSVAALATAISFDNFDIVKVLIELGVPLSVDFQGQSLLSFAKARGNQQIIDYLTDAVSQTLNDSSSSRMSC